MHSQVNEDAEVMAAADTQPPVDPRSLIVYETRTRQNRSKSTPGPPILQSDIALLQAEHVESIRPIRRARSARTNPDDESEDELSRPSDYGPHTRPEPASDDTLMTTNLADSAWADDQ
jgi:hypothetical protein